MTMDEAQRLKAITGDHNANFECAQDRSELKGLSGAILDNEYQRPIIVHNPTSPG